VTDLGPLGPWLQLGAFGVVCLAFIVLLKDTLKRSTAERVEAAARSADDRASAAARAASDQATYTATITRICAAHEHAVAVMATSVDALRGDIKAGCGGCQTGIEELRDEITTRLLNGAKPRPVTG